MSPPIRKPAASSRGSERSGRSEPLASASRRTATVVARTPVTIEVLNRAEFGSLLAEFPDLAARIMATMAQRLAELEEDG